MTRVTIAGGLNPDNLYEVECERLYVDNYEYIMISKTGSVTKHKHYIDEIYKVEKQVKDLTLDECRFLNIDFYDYEAKRNVWIVGDYDVEDLSMDDYIDVTELIKEKY